MINLEYTIAKKGKTFNKLETRVVKPSLKKGVLFEHTGKNKKDYSSNV